MYNFDEYYDNYNEFDRYIKEFKDTLKVGLKKEIKDELEKLKKENAELQEIKTNWNALEREYKNKIKEVEREKESVIKNAKREFYQDKLKDFLEKAFEARELYEVVVSAKYLDKCDMCDSNRKIYIRDVFDREHKVNCKCTSTYNCYSVKKEELQLYIQKYPNRDDFYIALQVWDTHSTYTTKLFGFGDRIFKEDNNETIYNKFEIDNPPKSIHRAHFTNKDEAQKYADYLNEKETKEKGINRGVATVEL